MNLIYRIVLFLLATVSIVACHKSNEIPIAEKPYIGNGSMTVGPYDIKFQIALMNESTFPDHEGLYTLTLANKDEDSVLRITTFMTAFKLVEGKQKMQYRTGDREQKELYSYMYTWTGDHIQDRYDLLDTSSDDNYLELYDINEEAGWVKGRFKVTYLRVSNVGFQDFPDTLSITDGWFDAQIVKR